MLHAGHCTSCDGLIWRMVPHPRTGEAVILYPRPDSVYAQVMAIDGSRRVAPGIGYCASHAPALDADGPALPGIGPTRVVGLDAAGLRYANWYSPAWGETFAAWLNDHLELPECDREALIAQWDDDRRLVEAAHA